METLNTIILSVEPKEMPATIYFLLAILGVFAVAALWVNIYKEGKDDEGR